MAQYWGVRGRRIAVEMEREVTVTGRKQKAISSQVKLFRVTGNRMQGNKARSFIFPGIPWNETAQNSLRNKPIS